ncbi:MAG: bifunctional folylpolyglutamate synthase/dihydrofolate synthase [Rickettsiales bacterium]|nr:bifunctional folylpolyglutamate synthase/dihydrofolate synthase [Rickettsiales bacterium]
MKMPSWPKPLGMRPSDFDLTRIQQLLANLGNPQHNIPPVLHIAGTNGKGSTLAFIKAILEAAGYRVHRYTSPHLINFNERITLAGQDISDAMLNQVADECRHASENIKVTFFEGTTAMAFLAFSKVDADIVLLETGMGGRLDATNLIEKPLLTAITTVSYDHMEFLGTTLTAIAKEKAGIMKQSVPCVISYQEQESLTALENASAQIGVPLFRYGHEWQVQRHENGFYYMEGDAALSLPKPSLFGPHQYINAGTAVACVQCLEGFTITEEHIRNGLQNTSWSCRMERINKGNLLKLIPENWEVWLDGAHNKAGSQMLSHVADEWSDRPLFVIAGITKGRKCDDFFKPLAGKVKHVCGVRVESEPSAYPAAEVASQIAKTGINTSPAEDLEDAINTIKSMSDVPARILICGSLYLAGDVKYYNEL